MPFTQRLAVRAWTVVGTILVRWLVPPLQWTGRGSQCTRCDGHLLDNMAQPGRSHKGDDVGGRRPDIQSILQLTAWAAEPAFQQRVLQGQERLPVSGDVASSIGDLFDVQSFREKSVEYNEHFKNCLYAVARETI
jgi:hypothetical protein